MLLSFLFCVLQTPTIAIALSSFSASFIIVSFHFSFLSQAMRHKLLRLLDTKATHYYPSVSSVLKSKQYNVNVAFMTWNPSFVFFSLTLHSPIDCRHNALHIFSDHLKTVSLRPTWMYGEEDERFFPTIMRFADKWNGMIPRMAEGGKKQLCYVGEFYDHCGLLKYFLLSLTCKNLRKWWNVRVIWKFYSFLFDWPCGRF